MRKGSVVFVCGPSKEYFYGDPCPDKALGYLEFCEWAEAQRRKRRRPKKKKAVDRASTVE